MKKHLSYLTLLSVAALVGACNGGSSGSSGSGGSSGTVGNVGTGGGTSCNARSNAQDRISAPKLLVQHLVQPVSHIPKAVKSFSDQGKYSEATVLPITVALNLSNESDLEERLTEMYSPGNPNYGHFMNPGEFRARYAPTDEQIAQVQAYLASSGVDGLAVNKNGYLISGKATVKSLNSMLQTEIHQYKDAAGKNYFAPASEPKLRSDLLIAAVHGLNNVTHAHSYSHPRASNSAPIKAGSGHSGGFAPADIHTAYNMPSSVTGSGQTLGLFELDAYNQSDITAYEAYYNLPNVTVTPVAVDSAATGSPGGGIAEVELDIELQIAVAPGASQILVYEGPNSETGMVDTYAKIASDNQAKEISSSWGDAEDGTSSSQIQSENTIFMQMAAQGQSIFSASGDSGADDDGSTLSIDDPSGQPYMTATGGTTLTTGTNGAYTSETTWSSGGGGVSSVWPTPTWQQGLATSTNLASSTMRNIPDVSINADMNTGYDIYEAGTWGTWGGTSCAAPLWAAFTALVNQQRAANGMGTIGFINPAIYAIGQGSNYGADFHDIADGSTNGHYPAVTGYDDATGWGTPNGQNLFNDLTSNSGC